MECSPTNATSRRATGCSVFDCSYRSTPSAATYLQTLTTPPFLGPGSGSIRLTPSGSEVTHVCSNLSADVGQMEMDLFKKIRVLFDLRS